MSPTSTRRLAVAVVATLLVGAAACSTDDDAATPDTTLVPSTSGPPNTVPPATTATPTTTPASPATTDAPTTTAAIGIDRRPLLQGILDSHVAAGEVMGARIALADRDGTITELAAGRTSVDPTSASVDLDVPWNIGSATKTFVAVVALQLADEGRLDLDAGIAGYLPDLADADRITPRQLLQHTSGLGEYLDDPVVQADKQRPWTPAELIAVAEAAGRVGEPGGTFHYANTNYIVLGEIVERVTGHPWSDEVHARITEPLGMTSTDVIADEHPAGSILVDGQFVDATYIADPSVGGAAGALASNGRDLLRFAAALADGRLLSPASQAAMQDFVPGEDLSTFGITHGYGLGLERYVTADITVIGHLGTGEAQAAFVGYDPDDGTAVAVMTNSAVAGPQGLMAIETLTAVAEQV